MDHRRNDLPPARNAVRVLRGLVVTVRALLAFAVLIALICGIPYGLVHYIGWPLPTHLPSWDETQATLLGPMTPNLLLDVLACLLWPLWARFTFDVLATVPDAVRATRWSLPGPDSTRGPLRAVAGVLVSTVVVAILGSRSLVPNSAVTPAMSLIKPAAVATVDTPRSLTEVDPSLVITATLHTQLSNAPTAGTETVRPPEQGVYDSLWRIAERRLGDGNRWPDIWALNCGKVQIDGRTLTTPSLIQPGWVLQLPTPAAVVASPPARPTPTSGSGQSTIEPLSPAQQTPRPPATVPSIPVASPAAGISLTTGAYVGLGFAALVTVALMTVRLRRRRWYRPGLAEPDDASFAPVVRGIRIAHDAAIHYPDQETDGRSPTTSSPSADVHTRDRAGATSNAVLPTTGETVVAVTDGCPVALDLARARGIGLTGPGAHAAARALILSLIATSVEKNQQHAQVIITAEDATALLGADAPHPPPDSLRIVADLDTALDLLDAELLSRTRQFDNEPPNSTTVLVAAPEPGSEARIQSILDNGSTLGLAGILLGQWRPGGTVRVRADGTVGAASAAMPDGLRGARLFILPESDAADLLRLLRAAQPTTSEPVIPEPRQENAQYDFVMPATEAESVVEPPTTAGQSQHALQDGELSGSRTTTVNCTAQQASSDTAPDEHEDTASARETTTEATNTPLHLHVLGRLRLIHHADQPTDIIDALAPRQREILIYLALHRNGVRRETLTTTLWPEAPCDRPHNSFHATLSQLRKALRQATNDDITNLTTIDDGHYMLDRSLITVDLWQVQDALVERRRTNGNAHTEALHHIADMYHGDLANSVTTDWIDAPREALRRDVLDALSILIREIGPDDGQRLTLLEKARTIDPYNEAIYRDLMRTQARLGRYDAIPRTLSLLTSSLAELDEQPTHDTLGLADTLRRPRVQKPQTQPAS